MQKVPTSSQLLLAPGDAGTQSLFSPDDLLGYNTGTMQEQFRKQKRVLACVLVCKGSLARSRI